MLTDELVILDKDTYKASELESNGFEYTAQNFADYLIYRRDEKYFLISKVDEEHFKLQFCYDA